MVYLKTLRSLSSEMLIIISTGTATCSAFSENLLGIPSPVTAELYPYWVKNVLLHNSFGITFVLDNLKLTLKPGIFQLKKWPDRNFYMRGV